MKARLILASLLLATSLFGQSFTNANVREVSARGGVAQAIGNRDGWFAWSVPMAGDGRLCCWNEGSGCCGGCTLDGNRGWSVNKNDARHAPTGDMAVVVQIDNGAVTRVRLFDANCAVDARGATVHVLRDVDAGSSISWLVSQAREGASRGNSLGAAIAHHEHPNAIPALEQLANAGSPTKVREDALFWIGQRGGERGMRFLADFLMREESESLGEKAVFALSQNDAPGAIPALISIARTHRNEDIRGKAIFWLGQRAGGKAADELRRIVDEDPDQDIREKAVFAISQLPKDRAVPILIDLVRTHKSPAVRKKAMFWLTQTGDPRALDVIEEILKK